MIDKASERWTVCFAAILFALSSAVASAATFHIDISPAPGTALNLSGVNLYNGDHAVGLSEANAIVPGGSGTGNETGPGITYDDVSQELNLNFDCSGLFGINPAVRFQRHQCRQFSRYEFVRRYGKDPGASRRGLPGKLRLRRRHRFE